MRNNNISRRSFARTSMGVLAGAGLGAISTPQMKGATFTAGDIVDRIRKNVNVPWNEKSFRDTYKIGSADMKVTSIATTFMSTLDVLQRAHAAGCDMVITHEPTFWSDADLIPPVENDPLYKLKLAFGNQNKMVVWRFHDNWHARNPDGIAEGWDKAVGWDQYQMAGPSRRWELPPTTLGDVARHLVKILKSRSIRIIGDPALPVRTVIRGGHNIGNNLTALPQADLLIISEAREWDSAEYVRDTVLSGQKKGAIVIAHEAGEEWGMDHCANWLRGFITEIPIQFVETKDQFWIPA